MNNVRLPSRTANSTPEDEIPGARESRLSRYCLLWLLVAPFVGFVLAGRVFMLGANGEEWELWKAAVLGGVLMVPFAVGVYFGLRAVRKRFLGGWVGLVGNVVLGVIALAMPISEALAA